MATVSATGSLDFRGASDLTYEASADLSHLQPLLGIESLRGSLQLEGSAAGVWPDLDATGRLTAADVVVQDGGCQSLELDYRASQLGSNPVAAARLQLQNLTFGELRVETAEFQASYEGSLREVTFEARLAEPPLMESRLGGRLSLGNSVRHAVFDIVELRFGDRVWRAPKPLNITMGPGTLDVGHFRLERGEESVSLTGRIENRSLYGVRLEASSIDLTYLKSVLGLPDPVVGRASFSLQGVGSFSEPVLRGDLRITPSPAEDLPFELLHAAVRYESRELTGQISIRQEDRDVLHSEVEAPLYLGLADIPLSRRLMDGPLSLSLRLRRPDLTSLRAVMPALLLTGDLQGNVSIYGTYAQLELASEIDWRNGGLGGMLEKVFAPVRMTAELTIADSMPLPEEALASHALTLRLRRLDVHMDSASGRLPAMGTGQISRPVEIADARLQAEATWSADGFEATISSLKAETDISNLPAALSARAHLTASSLTLRHLQVQTPESRIEASGELTLADRSFELHMEVPRLNPGEFSAVVPPFLSSEVHGDAWLDGSPSELMLVANLRYGQAAVQVEGSADLQESAFSADVTVSELALDHFLPVGSGKLNANLSLQGSGFGSPDRKADLHLSFNSEEIDLAPELKGVVRAALTGSVVSLEELRIDSVPLQLKVAGALSENRQLQADYQVIFKDWAPFGPQSAQPVLTSGSLAGSMGGSLGALRTRGDLRLESWTYGDFQGGQATLTFEGEDLATSPRSTLTATFEGVQGRGMPTGSVTLGARYQDGLARFDAAVTDGPYQRTRVAGRVTLQEEQNINLSTLHLKYRHWSWENAGPVRIVRQPGGAILLEDFHLVYGEQAIQGNGSWDPSGPLAASIRVHQLEIKPWLLTFLPAVSASGRLSLDLDLSGNTESPEAAGVLQLRDLTWKELPLGRIRVASSFRDGRLENHFQWHDGDRQILEIKGNLGLQKDYPLELRAQSSSLDLARLAAGFDVVEHSGGLLDLQLHAGGTVADPDLTGELAIRDGVLLLASTGERYRDIEAQLTLNGNRLELAGLTAASSKGTLRAGGWLETEDLRLKDLYLSLRAQDFKLMNTESVQGRLTGAIEARGPLDALAVKGNVTIPRARIRLDDFGAGPVSVSPEDLTVSGVYSGDPEEVVGGSETTEAESDSPVVRGLRTELSVRLPRNSWVVGPETAVEIEGTLLVKKLPDEPFILGGSAQTVRGHVTYRGRKFDLERGRVTFSGAEENKPILDVLARHNVSDYTITLHVEGDSRAPDLTFSSSPELPEEDILSLLAFGKTIDRLSGSEKTALSSQGAAIAGNIISSILEKRFGDTLGLDTLEFEVGDELGTGSVRGGRYVTQDLFLSYERQIGEQGGNTVEVEYSLGPRVKLKGASDDKGQSSLDLFWHIEY